MIIIFIIIVLCVIYSYRDHIRTLEVRNVAGLSLWLLTARHRSVQD